MGFALQTAVGPQKLADSTYQSASLRQSGDGMLVVTEGHGKYYEQAIRGNVWFDSIPLAGIVLATMGTGNLCLIEWNSSPFYTDEIVRLELSYISGANVPGGFAWWYLNAGYVIGTGAPMATFVTPGTSVNANMNGSIVKGVTHRYAYGASTYPTVTPTFYKSASLSMLTAAAASTGDPFQLVENYDGVLNMPPGIALVFGPAQANGTGTFTGAITLIENTVPMAAS